MERSEATRNTIIELLRELLGEEILRRLETFDVSDIWCNSDGKVWLKDSRGRRLLGLELTTPQSQQIISYVADLNWRTAEDASAIVEADLPWGGRFEGVMPPHIKGGSAWCIRNHLRQSFPLESYVETERCDKHVMQAIDLAMRQRANIAIIGITGSGKTSFLDSLCTHPTVVSERVISIEEVRELKLDLVEDKQCMTIDPRRVYYGRDNVARYRLVAEEINALVRAALRMTPDRILIGEARGGELHELVKALYSGHAGGITTIHADHPRDAMHRMELMLAEAVSDVRPFRFMLCDVFDRIIWIRRDRRGGGKIEGIYKPRGWNDSKNTYVIDTLAGTFLE